MAEWVSDEKPWHFKWQIPNKTDAWLRRHSKVLGALCSHMFAVEHPSYITALTALRSKPIYRRVAEFDETLIKRVAKIEYLVPIGKKGYSVLSIGCVEKIQTIAELYELDARFIYDNRNPKGVRRLVSELDDLMQTIAGTPITDDEHPETEAKEAEFATQKISGYRAFCDALVKNKSGLHIS